MSNIPAFSHLKTDLVVDNSILKDMGCSTLGAMKHVLHLEVATERVPIVSGQAAHEALAWYFCGKGAEAALKRFDTQYRKWSKAHVPADDRLAWQPLRRILEHWMRKHPLERFPLRVDPREVEVPIAAVLGYVDGVRVREDGDGQRVVMVALLDMVGKMRTGGRWPTDHKGQPLDAPILTPTGWRTMGSLQVGDEVVGSDGEATAVTGVFPLGTRALYEVGFSDGSVVECTDDHAWTVRAQGWRGRDAWRTMTLRELQEQPSYVAWQVPIVLPVDFQERVLPLDPYVLGALLGDGYFGASTPALSASEGKQWIVDTVASLLPPSVCIKKAGGENHTWNISGDGRSPNAVTEALKGLGLWGKLSRDKFIPESYLYADMPARRALLQGLLDTDGCCTKGGYVHFDSVSTMLVGDVVQLARSLGCVVSSRPRSDKGFRVTIRAPYNPFGLPRKAERWVAPTLSKRIQSIRPIGMAPAQCISVAAKDGLYVTSGCTVTHNTTGYVNDWFRDEQQDSSQFTGQIWILKKNRVQVPGVYVNALEFRPVPGSTRKCSTHGTTYAECGLEHCNHQLFPVTRSPHEIATWETTARALATKYVRLRKKVQDIHAVRELPMEGRFLRMCRGCSFREWCRLGRPAGAERTFEKRKWDPLAHAQELAASAGVARGESNNPTTEEE